MRGFPLIVILSVVALLDLPVFAAPNQPGSPRSSILSPEEVKQVYRKRQASSKDVARRQQQRPKRKRQDPSNPACQASVGQNAVVNGDFETSTTLSPWVPTVAPGMQLALNGGAGVDQSNAAAVHATQGHTGTTASLAQTAIPICAGYSYTFSAYIGKENDNLFSSCSAVYTITGDDGYSEVVYSGSPCASGECTYGVGTGFIFQPYVYAGTLTFTTAQVASGVTLTLAYDCPVVPGSESLYYPVDNIQLKRV